LKNVVRRNMDLIDSANSARMAHQQGLRDYVERADKERASSAPARRVRGFGNTAHHSGLDWVSKYPLNT
jgi:hypothetical protein